MKKSTNMQNSNFFCSFFLGNGSQIIYTSDVVNETKPSSMSQEVSRRKKSLFKELNLRAFKKNEQKKELV